MRNSFIKRLCEIAAEREDIYLITGDLGFGVVEEFAERYPERFINVGIAEQNMTAVAAGLGLEGKCVFTYSIGNFPTLRCLEQIRNDVAYHHCNVNIVAVGGGFSYGALGMSHHATEDLAIMRAIPDMVVFTPCDPGEALAATTLAVELQQPCYIRLARGKDQPIPHITKDFQVGKANLLWEGEDAAIFAAGPVASEAIKAAQILEETENIHCAVWNCLTVKPMDEETVLAAAKQAGHIFTVEEHTVVGGLGGAVAEVMASHGVESHLHRLGLQDEFTGVVGEQSYLREIYGISADKLVETIKQIFKEEK